MIDSKHLCYQADDPMTAPPPLVITAYRKCPLEICSSFARLGRASKSPTIVRPLSTAVAGRRLLVKSARVNKII